MDWIINDSPSMPYHTNLSLVLAPFVNHLDDYKWVLSNFEFNHTMGLPVNYDQDYFILSAADIRQIMSVDVQAIWAVLIAVPVNSDLIINKDNIPYADCNPVVWTEGNMFLPEAVIQIIGFDSSCTIVKFANADLSNKFKAYFEDAIPLKEYVDRYK